jgi:hypothetical protein
VTDVTLGRTIAAAVSTQIVQGSRFVNGSADFDGRAMHAPPDAYNF